MSCLDARMRASLEFPGPEKALASGKFIDATSPELRALSAAVNDGASSQRERAMRAFEHVRDTVRYEFMAKFRPEQYRAPHVLGVGTGFCVQKAVLLAALLRASGIPSALVLGDLRDRTMPQRVVEAMGTDVMHGHGFTAVFLDGAWMLIDASHDRDFARCKGYELVSWAGKSDALISAHTRDGRRHAEFVALWGVFLDLPFEALLDSFAAAYADVDLEALAATGLPVAEVLSGAGAPEWILSKTGQARS